jgi:hypothetical protein
MLGMLGLMQKPHLTHGNAATNERAQAGGIESEEDTAFPSEFVTSNNNAGLTKLEYMATHIAVGIMASIGENEHTTPEHTAGISVKYAKALIAELNKEQQ